MKNLTKFEFSAWRDGDRRACYIRAEFPESKLKMIYFYMDKEEFLQFCRGSCSITDISHNLNSFGNMVRFYDLDFPNSSHGTQAVNFVNLNWPIFSRQILLHWAEEQWKSEESHMQRPTIKVSNEKLARWEKNYGNCTGQINLVVCEDSKEFFNKCNESIQFQTNVERLITIGKGYTQKFFETVNLYLYKDYDGFYFNFGKVKFNGKIQPVGLNGGLINHGKEKPDWSIHT